MSNVQLFGFDDTNKQYNPVHIDSNGALSTTATMDTTGLATDTLQTAGNASLASLDTKVVTCDTSTIGGTVAVSGVGGNVAITAAALPLPSGAASSAAQTDGSQVAKIRGDDSGTSRDVQVDANGKLNVNAAVSSVAGNVAITAAALPLPSGAATESSLATIAACENGGQSLQVDIQADGVGIASQTLQSAGNASLTAIENCVDTGVNQVNVYLRNEDIGLATSMGQTSLESKVDELNENNFSETQETINTTSTVRGSALNCTNYSRVELMVERDSTSTATGMTHVQLQWSASGTGDWIYTDFYQSLYENYDVDGSSGAQYNVSIMSDVKNKYVRYAIYNDDFTNQEILNVHLARIH